MKLVIAEKPSVANSIAEVIGANDTTGDGYRSGNGYIVSWCVGHLIELSEPASYGEQYEKWTYDSLPIIPDSFSYEGDMENEERKHGQFNRGSEDDLCISGDSAGDRGTHEHSGGRNPGENERDGEHDASGEISVPEEDLRQVSGIVEEFRANTRDKFHELDGENSESIETMVRGHIEDAIETFGLDAKVVDVVLVGSRSRGIEHEESDVNVVVEFYGSEREDALSDILNEEGLSIAGKTIDINTITKDRTGTLETFLPEEEKYLAEKAAAMEQTAASKNMVADMSIEQAAEAELNVLGNIRSRNGYILYDIRICSIYCKKEWTEYSCKKTKYKHVSSGDWNYNLWNSGSIGA